MAMHRLVRGSRHGVASNGCGACVNYITRVHLLCGLTSAEGIFNGLCGCE